MSENLLKKTMVNLEKNGISSWYVEKRKDVVPRLKELLDPGSTVGVGGSMTLFECDVIEFLRKGDFIFLDRYAPDLSGEQISQIYARSAVADHYLCSCNAVTEQGELYNVDGRSNRVSAIAYGPKSVILVVSVNKIVANLDEAVYRVKTIAAPRNCVRLDCDTYCRNHGKCMSLLKENSGMTDGCQSADRICCNYLVSARQRQKGRIKIIFIGEESGY
jgi:L-lactate utilization protein LutB